MFGDARQHAGPNFVFVVKSPNVIGEYRFAMSKFDVGAGLRNGDPSNFLERLKDPSGLQARPLAHVDRQSMLIDFGTSRDFSTSSAMDRRARA